ncbi:PTS sugar transporter subunit IIA [Thermanaerothrix sp.]|jgi:mannitol operon transcriptional antiterminator|uniref:PTS sugar transporter subunit IIA n=1 Tax=Thermanaerothrix sp. TaxID=2972675 RepID=UPI002ADE9078|nr:PTS sugar transporter subunit IIA [Thermanaerothrix sp.]
MFTPETIALRVPATDWEEAVRAAGRLLVASGAAEPRYIDGMIRTVRELGPYIVIAPGIALPHARPEEGALREGYALVTLAQPINFGNPDNDPVQVVIAFCAPDASTHLESLRALAERLGQPDFVPRLLAAQTPQEVLSWLAGDTSP